MNNEIKFEVIALSEKQKNDIAETKELSKKALAYLNEILPQGRYLSICKTKLEELSMFANKGISLREIL